MTLRLSLFSLTFFGLVSCAPGNRAPTAPVVSLSPIEALTTDDLVVSIVTESSDSEGDNISYKYKWLVDGLLRDDLTEKTVPAAETAKGQLWTVLVSASDGEFETTSEELSLTILNTPAVVSLEVQNTDPASTDDLVAIATVEDADDDELDLAWSWTVDGDATGETEDTVPADATAKGEEWEVSLVVSDGDSEVSPDPVAVVVLNSAPSITEVLLAPTEAFESTLLTASATTADEDGDSVSLAWSWSVNGTLIADADSSTLDGTHFDKHDAVVATATPSDDDEEGDSLESNALTILNTPPAITGVTLEPVDIYEATTVSCTPAGWSDEDSDTESYVYTWEIDGVAIGETGASIDGAHFSRGNTVVCTATPDDGEATGDTQTSPVLTVNNTPPSATTATLSTTAPQEGDTITVTVSGATDEDGDTVTYQYAWYVGGAFVAATSELTSSYFSSGQSIWVDVTPYDGTDAGSAVTSNTATAINTPPVLDSATLTPSTVAYSGTLSCLPGTATDVDADIITYAYTWLVDGSPVIATTSTLDNTWFLPGSSVFCTITPHDGTDSGTSITSNIVTVNNPPSVGNVVVSPAAPTAADAITCQHDTPTDADGDNVSVAYAWTIGAVAAASTSSTLGASVQRDQVVACTVTPSDPYESGAAAAASVTVVNSPPQVSSVTLSPSAPTTDSVVTANALVSDLDGDTVSLTYAFSVGNSLTQNSASNQLAGSAHFARGDEISVTVTPQDGQNQGAAHTGTVPVTVVNSPPTAPGISISPLDPEFSIDSLTCAINTPSSDADTAEKGDTVQYYFDWIDPTGSVVQSVGPTTTTSNVISASSVGAGMAGAWVCEVTPTDGIDDGPVASANVTVTESCTTLPQVSLVPTLSSNTSAQSSHSITVSASSEHGSTYPAWKAFNASNSHYEDCWHSSSRFSNSASHPEWIEVDFGPNNSVYLSEAKLTSRNHYQHRFPPTTYQIEGSNNGSTWTVLINVQNDYSITGQNQTVSHSASNTTTYRYLRLNIDVVDGGNQAALGELEFIGCYN